jgi:hypothetical protein
MSIFRIGKEYQEIQNALYENGGELTPELETALAINKENLTQKSVSLALLIKDGENQLDAIKKESDRLDAMKKAIENSNERIKNTIKHFMELYEVSEIKGETLKLSFRRSKQVVIDDDSLVPVLFKELVPESYKTCKADIKKAIEDGGTVPGARVVENYNLQIK